VDTCRHWSARVCHSRRRQRRARSAGQ